ncbi:DUF1636 family protein [Mangrovicoccus algicola]|uniref:DUF1636 domain-containing protein n=1 Tax=Mangrovicoccus algicola TaxID=2771008 RepID=A0A8J6YVV4_9RHOB|nr:DUF1636 domain-containing protein [Mangrovicoccus algicola]MBE3638587.1 DUF1636 domain-containing protein [Mangrovicoccus algicola]
MTTITVCTTCRTAEGRADRTLPPQGEAFLAQLAAAAMPGVTVRGTACLMGCDQGCTLAISDHGKLSYVLGRFGGDAQDAGAVADFARFHAESGTGQVPFRQWPQGVKGHFIARIPPLD